MKNYKLSFLKITALIFSFVLFTTGCSGQIISNPDFKDITNKIVLDKGDDSNGVTTSENESNVSDSTTEENIKSEDYTATEETKRKAKVKDYIFSIDKVQNVQKFGVEDRCSAKYLLANIAYMKGNVIKDTLFDGLIFCNPNSMFYDYGNPGSIAELTQKDWQNIIDMGYKPGVNVNALEEAAGVLKDVLEIPQYKVGVFFFLGYPCNTIENWGEIDGRAINLKEHPEDRVTVLKWLIDEHIKEFRSHNYKNIEICGFYYFSEKLWQDEGNFLPQITDYVRSKGLKTVWAPYFNASGWNRGFDVGFDEVCLQPNYFRGNMSLPNAGGKERISTATKHTTAYDMSIEMELCHNTSREAISGFKEYMQSGSLYGWMDKFHTWWIHGGINTIYNLYRSSDSYIRSAYDDMYKFMCCSLDPDEINIE